MSDLDIGNDWFSADSLQRRFEANRTLVLILGFTAIALLARLLFLGERIAHFDEGRVAYWALHFAETGQFHYRFIIHGPFVQFVDNWLFTLIGPNDFTMRLPVAIIGGVLPASVLLFRNHLRDPELIGAAFFLSLNPILVYYSRFFRSTVPAVAFAFVALGLVVRAYDTRKARYVCGAAIMLAFAFAAKENAIVYLLTWLGATALLIDLALVRPRNRDSGLITLKRFWATYIRGVLFTRAGLRVGGYLISSILIFLALSLFFYAPRAGSAGGVGLWKTVANPGQFPALIETTLYGTNTPMYQPGVITGYEHWLGGGADVGNRYDSLFDRYLSFLRVAMEAISSYGATLVLLAIIGFFTDRYGAGSERNLVMFASYWGFVSLLGFPLGSDIANAWLTVNGLVPLAIPAGVGLALFYRWGKTAWEKDDNLSAAITAFIFLLIVSQIGVGLATGVYTNHQSRENKLVQFAQPGGDFRPELERIRTATTEPGEPDVLVYDNHSKFRALVDGHKEAVRKPPCVGWHNALPLPWYFAMDKPAVECAINESQLDERLTDPPPVIIAHNRVADDVRERLPEYRSETYELRAGAKEVTFFTAPELGQTQSG